MTIMNGIDLRKASHTAVAIDNRGDARRATSSSMRETDRAAALVGGTVPGSGVGNLVRPRPRIPVGPTTRRGG